jgi:CDP-paratose 2-epimerase
VAHFAISSVFGHPINIYGDGYQVRDVLHVDDLVAALDTAVRWVDRTDGRIYNIGGGPENAISLRWLVALLSEESGMPIQLHYSDWRPGDQKVYVSDIRKARSEMGWAPALGAREGVRKLLGWVRENQGLFDWAHQK